MTTTAGTSTGLRERKKRRTQQALQAAAIRLMSENGFARTTIDQIADAADVSPRTFFRYFPSKESALLTDLQDEVVAVHLAAAPAELSIAAAYEAAVRAAFDDLSAEEWKVEQARMRLVVTTPELGVTAAVIGALRPIEDAGEFIRRRLGLEADDPRPAVYAAMLVAAVAAAVVPLLADLEDGALDRAALLDAMHLGVEVLQDGFPTGLEP
ncbi:TetR family transcriptional regulator [Microlunatus elymi]|uniref:TetR family transcriptional regulator n=1 Tax=Microlunatus elymi TaxID=2596828 RepID=A0A516Q2J5_9ACTN|nr:TetR family transcriptional regulator [Microlunatus elymi]QDP97628.1 TetR family transcriptional regulator [Microlunatus elymi]